jgi:hypothetical protein
MAVLVGADATRCRSQRVPLSSALNKRLALLQDQELVVVLLEPRRTTLGTKIREGSRLGYHEYLITEGLRYQPNGDSGEGVSDEVLNTWLSKIKLHDGNLAAALAQFNDVGVYRYPMLDSIDGVNGHPGSPVDAQVDGQDRIAIPINSGQLIEAGLVQDGFGIIGRDCPDVVVEVGPGRTKHSSPAFHGGTFSLPGERTVSFRLLLERATSGRVVGS